MVTHQLQWISSVQNPVAVSAISTHSAGRNCTQQRHTATEPRHTQFPRQQTHSVAAIFLYARHLILIIVATLSRQIGAHQIDCNSHRGVTLVELMVSMLLGIVLSGGMVSALSDG